MDTNFMILGIVAVVIVVIGILGYMITTNIIIREQEKEIVHLKNQLKQERQKEPLVIEKSGKYPEFGGF